MMEGRITEPRKEEGFKTELGEQWPLILVLFLVQVFAFGFPTYALQFIYAGATEEFGWTRQQAVLLASFKFYVSAAAALVAGRCVGRSFLRRCRNHNNADIRDRSGHCSWGGDCHRSRSAEAPLWCAEFGTQPGSLHSVHKYRLRIRPAVYGRHGR